MNRRKAIKSFGVGLGMVTVSPIQVISKIDKPIPKKKGHLLRIAHITDVHLHSIDNVPNRFKNCIEEIKTHKIDFVLNGGDSIMAADYSHITRESVNDQWKTWHNSISELSGYEIYSCLGNHDMWWAAPDKTDPMYGKDYVVKQLGIPNRYYGLSKMGWHFIVLDSNNKNAGSIDKEQWEWLENELNSLPSGTPVIMMSHYPILSATTIVGGGGNHTDAAELAKLFYKHKDKKINSISGHMHMLDRTTYNNVDFYCNGSLSGFWWGEGDENSAQKYWYLRTPPGYAILDLYNDGSMENSYCPHNF